MPAREMIGQLWKSSSTLLVTVAVLVVLNLSLFMALEQVLLPKVAEQEDLYIRRQDELRKLSHGAIGTAKSPEQLYVLASQDLSRFHQSIPDYAEFTGLIEELLVLSGRARLDISQISYASKELEEPGVLQFSLGFDVAGDYDQVKKFIHSLEQSTRLMAIKQISLSRADELGVSLRMSLETYFRAGEEP